jgi:hypothetical protein
MNFGALLAEVTMRDQQKIATGAADPHRLDDAASAHLAGVEVFHQDGFAPRAYIRFAAEFPLA